MLYFFYGDDIVEVKKRALRLVESLRERKPQASYFTVSPDNWREFSLEELLHGRTLFEQNYIVLGDRLSHLPAEDWEAVVSSLETMAGSSHVFLLVEQQLNSGTFKKIEKYADRSEIRSSQKGGPSVQEFDVFALTEAAANRQKGKSWELFHLALQSGKRPEEIYGLLFWQFKTIVLAARTSGAEEAGVKNFPYQKARRFQRNFSFEELENKLYQLTLISYTGYSGKRTLSEELERFLLTL